MKFLAKIALITAATSAGAILAAPNGGGFISPSGTGGISVSANMSFEDMLSRSSTITKQIHGDYQHVEHLRAIARREKDVIKLNCVNDKLVEIKPQMNIADRVAGELASSREAGDRRSAFESVLSAGDNIRRLREAADQCVGEKLLVTESSNEYTHPDIPEQPGGTVNGEIEPPAYASPFD